MSGSELLAISAPPLVRVPMKDRKLFPTIGFILLRLVPGKQTLVPKPDSSGHAVQRSKANGGAKVPMKH